MGSIGRSEGKAKKGVASENLRAGKSLAIHISISPSPWKLVPGQENQVTSLWL